TAHASSELTRTRNSTRARRPGRGGHPDGTAHRPAGPALRRTAHRTLGETPPWGPVGDPFASTEPPRGYRSRALSPSEIASCSGSGASAPRRAVHLHQSRRRARFLLGRYARPRVPKEAPSGPDSRESRGWPPCG